MDLIINYFRYAKIEQDHCFRNLVSFLALIPGITWKDDSENKVIFVAVGTYALDHGSIRLHMIRNFCFLNRVDCRPE